MKKFLMIVVLSAVCLSGCISITNAPVTTPAAATPTVSVPIRTSDVQTPVQTPTVVTTPSVTNPCTTCGGYYQYPQYQYPQYQYPCTTCQQQTPTVIYQPSTPTVIYQYPAKPTTVLPAGWEWYWDGSQWISRQIPGYVTPIAIPVVPIPVIVTPAVQSLNDFNVTDLGYQGSGSWRSQTFTVSSVSQVSVSMEKIGNPGDVICEVGGSSYRASASSIGGKNTYVFPVSASSASSLILHVTSGDRNNFYRIYGTNFDSYGGGTLNTSGDGGRTWRSYPNLDMFFSIN